MLLVARGITKRFGTTWAVKGADLELRAGELHAVVGENGAGKSTLLKVCAGIVAQDEGEVLVDGVALARGASDAGRANDALSHGVALVQQHLALVGTFTGLENILLGVEPVRKGLFGRLDPNAALPRIQSVIDELGFHVPLDVRVDTLGLADRQRLAIVRALYRDVRVLILDEPTAVLTPSESGQLYQALRRLASASQPRAVVVVTHKLDEVVRHADRATVLRRGEVRGTFATGDMDEAGLRETLTGAVMGDDPPPPLEPRSRTRDDVDARATVLELRDVHLDKSLSGVSFVVHAAEIVGIAGVEGNGQRELVDVIAGRVRADRGAVETPGSNAPPAVVFEDRQHEGLVLDASIADNAVLGELARFTKPAWSGLLDLDALDVEARRRLERARAKVDPSAPARVLSGGNQQKIVIGRALARVESGRGTETAAARVLVIAHPTRGVDLGASRAIHAEIARAADSGIGVVIVSSDLAELRALADRCLVLVRGRIASELPPSATDAEYGAAMLGGA